MKIYATFNIKGGVGKTTTAVNLAYLSASESGLRTVLWDLDPQGAASFMFRVKPRVKGGGKALIRGTRALDAAIKGTDFDNLDLIPADFTYRNMDLLLDSGGGRGAGSRGKPARKLSKLLAPLAAEYDAVFLDCPPSISLVSENVFRAADALLVPLVPTTLSIRTLEQLDAFLDSHKSVWGAAPNDVWAVGDGGAISHWNGTTWSQIQTGTFPYYPFLNKVHGSSAADVWVVGLSSDGKNTGVILHRAP